MSLYVIALMHIHHAYLDNTLCDTRIKYSNNYLLKQVDRCVSCNTNKITYEYTLLIVSNMTPLNEIVSLRLDDKQIEASRTKH